jgi:uncharacterized membrane protein
LAGIAIVYLLFTIGVRYIPFAQCNETFSRPFPEEGSFSPIPPRTPIQFYILGIIFLSLPLIMLYANIQAEKKLSASAELLSKLVNKHNGNKKGQPRPSIGRELIAKLLEPKEMAVVERLIEEPKGIQQSEIVKMPGMTKLKAHRIIEKLRQKGIIIVQRDGKTNQIKLDIRTRSLLSGLE